jgi:cytochrome c oxidase assembly protein subunit 15
MGCPDWPKCFGGWIPPTSVNQLPANYKEQYASNRDEKNKKFARYLTLVGLSETATKILEDKSILVEAEFNPTKTWTEYINRLVGAIIGLMFIALFIVSWRTRRIAPYLFKGSGIALILVIIQGWFGSIVVSTNLTTWTITIHMFLAVLLVAVLVWLLVRSKDYVAIAPPGLNLWLVAGMVILILQIFMGTQVRETLDQLALTMAREQWIANAGLDFIVHRAFSWVVLLIQVGIWLTLRKTTVEKSLTVVPFVLILLSLLTGTVMAYWAVPPFLQPLHLLLAVVTFGWFFHTYLHTNTRAAALLKN